MCTAGYNATDGEFLAMLHSDSIGCGAWSRPAAETDRTMKRKTVERTDTNS